MTPPDPGLGRRLQAVVDDALAADPEVPGIVARVASPRLGLSWTGTSGFEGWSGMRPAAAERPFRIASVTKPFVAAAAFRLQEQRKLWLHQPIETWLTGDSRRVLQSGGYEPDRISVLQLLSHTSGLRDHAKSDGYLAAVMRNPEKAWRRSDQVDIAVSLGPPLFEPGDGFEYSDTGYVLLGEIIEQAAEERLCLAVRNLIKFSQWGLGATWWELEEDAPIENPELASQYIGRTDASGYNPSFDIHGGGGLVSTMPDLCTFFRALFAGDVFESQSTLSAGLLIPRVDRQPDSHLHSNLGMVIPMGHHWGWGHLGFWGCGVAWSPATDLSIGVRTHQSQPRNPKILMELFEQLGRQVFC
ncbi:MAG: serine hydrolase domain-containing protein [Xanthomonadales bacterium]|nr:serine hydrolase domain-containing protein [Xanthomonadales bacterium]